MTPNLPLAVFEIKEYMVIFRQEELREFNGTVAKIRAMVRCIGTGTQPHVGVEHRLEVFFLAPDSPFPMPVIDLEKHTGQIFFPMSDLAIFVDVLRNERPIFGHLRADRPEWTSIMTHNEPVGEGYERD